MIHEYAVRSGQPITRIMSPTANFRISVLKSMQPAKRKLHRVQEKACTQLHWVQCYGMTTKQAKEAGRKHAEAGKSCTPFECRGIDANIFAIIKTMSPIEQAKTYKKLRGAFNRGWESRYFQIVSA